MDDRCDEKVGCFVKNVDLLQVNDRETLQIAPNTFLQKKKRLQTKQSALPSMGSIEESETENDASSSQTQELDFSRVPNLHNA